MQKKLKSRILTMGLIISIISIMFVPMVQASIQSESNVEEPLGFVYISSQQELASIGHQTLTNILS